MMNSKQALKLAQKKFGKTAWVRDNGFTFSDGELRPVDAEDHAKLEAKRDTHAQAEPRMKPLSEWADETPLGDFKVAKTAHEKAWKKWRKAKDLAEHKCWSSRFDVGYVRGFSTIAGSGNTWEEALAKAGCLEKPEVEIRS